MSASSVYYTVSLNLYGHTFSSRCETQIAAMEAVRSAHRALLHGHMGPLDAIEPNIAERIMYNELYHAIVAMAESWSLARRRRGYALLGGTILVQCFKNVEKGVDHRE